MYLSCHVGRSRGGNRGSKGQWYRGGDGEKAEGEVSTMFGVCGNGYWD